MNSLIESTISNLIPTIYDNIFLGLKVWQWVAGLVILFSLFIIEKTIAKILTIAVSKNFRILSLAKSDHLEDAIKPFRRLLFLLLLIPSIKLVALTPNLENIVRRGVIIASSFIAIWLARNIIEMISYYFLEKAKETESKFDDIIVPLVTKLTIILSYIAGAILVAHNLTINVSSLVAGLGIGGLAFAFAAKDTLANFFGSIMIVMDRPFDIGDYIEAGDLVGVVEEVGFRSTRIRTFNDSLITIANGELANRAIDNKGKRRFRRLNTTLGLEYDTPPAKIEAFCEGIRQLIVNHRWTRKDNFHVYFVNFGACSLDIQLVVYWKTDDYAREQVEKHRLMIDILRLSKELEIGFAFPTQTIHLFNEDKKGEHKIDDKYLEAGINFAKMVSSKPFTLKNPRSNASDKDQFGNNDFEK